MTACKREVIYQSWEDRCKNPTQNISKLNLAVHKKVNMPYTNAHISSY